MQGNYCWLLPCSYLNKLSEEEYNSIWQPQIFYRTKEPNEPNMELIIKPGKYFTQLLSSIWNAFSKF